MKEEQQAEALRLADELVEPIDGFQEPTILEAAAASELRRQHARIAELEAELEAVGAGGVESLRKSGRLYQIAEPVQDAAVQQGVQQAYVLEDDGHETYLDGCESRFSICRADGKCVAWVTPLDEDSGEAVAREMISALNATHPTQQGLEQDAARWSMVALISKEVMIHPDKRTAADAVSAYMHAVHSGLDIQGAIDAALAAQAANQGEK